MLSSYAHLRFTTVSFGRLALRFTNRFYLAPAFDKSRAGFGQPKLFERRLAERTGLEPATSCVTGRRSNQLNYRSSSTFCSNLRSDVTIRAPAYANVSSPHKILLVSFVACARILRGPDLGRCHCRQNGNFCK